MPKNGEINKRFGVYRSVCCEAEIVITEGASFPDCPKHPRLPTKWKALAADRPIPHARDVATEKKKSRPAA